MMRFLTHDEVRRLLSRRSCFRCSMLGGMNETMKRAGWVLMVAVGCCFVGCATTRNTLLPTVPQVFDCWYSGQASREGHTLAVYEDATRARRACIEVVPAGAPPAGVWPDLVNLGRVQRFQFTVVMPADGRTSP